MARLARGNWPRAFLATRPTEGHAMYQWILDNDMIVGFGLWAAGLMVVIGIIMVMF
jgi:hypothetical protein